MAWVTEEEYQAAESLRVSADIPAGEIEKNTDKK